jgi:dihydrofolate reductase
VHKVSIWCRNLDNVIGYGSEIPWHISSDFKRFKRVTKGNWLLMGRSTYESLPNKNLPNRKVLVLSRDKNYKVEYPKKHFVINGIEEALDYEIDQLYIAGGARIYYLVMKADVVKPDYIVDSVYQKHSPKELLNSDAVITISDTVKVLEHEYKKEHINDLDNVKTYIWYKKKDGLFNDLKTKIEGEANE